MFYRTLPSNLTERDVFHRWALPAGGADSELGDTRASYPAGMTTRPTNGTAKRGTPSHYEPRRGHHLCQRRRSSASKGLAGS